MKTSSWLAGLMLKDLLNLRSTIKTLIVMLLIFVVLLISMGSIMPIFFLMIIFAAILPTTSITMDDMGKWDRYALTLPVTRKDIVRSKYLLMIILIGSAILISVIIAAVSYYMMSDNVMSFWIILLVSAVGILYSSLILPLLYKFSSEKTRYIMLLPMILVGILIGGCVIIFGDSLPENLLLYILITAAVSVAAFIASYFVSVRLYEKKEF